MLLTALLLLVPLAAPPASRPEPRPIAVLPITGDGVSLADLPILEDIDTVVRAAVNERPGFVLQPRAMTAETFRSSRDAGVECKVKDLGCLRKIAALAGVELMIIPVAAMSGDGVELELTVISASDERIASRAALVKGRGRASDAFVRVLVDDVLTTPRSAAPVVASLAALAAPVAPAAPAPAPLDPAPAAEAASEDAGAVPTWLVVGGGVGLAVVAVTALAVGISVATGVLDPGGADPGTNKARIPASGPAVVVLE